MVLAGSLPLYNAFFEEHESDAPPEGWTWRDSHKFKEADLDWFYKRGCKWVKVEAHPGDVILWDSRTVHYGAAAHGDRPRVATCESERLSLPAFMLISNRRVLQASG